MGHLEKEVLYKYVRFIKDVIASIKDSCVITKKSYLPNSGHWG